MDALGASALVEVVDILSAEVETVVQLLLNLSEGEVGCVGLRGDGVATALGVEMPDELGVGGPGFRGGDLLDAVTVPEAAGTAEGGEATFGGDAGSGEDEEM